MCVGTKWGSGAVFLCFSVSLTVSFLPLEFLSCHVDPIMSLFSQFPFMEVFQNDFTTDGQLVYYLDKALQTEYLDGVGCVTLVQELGCRFIVDKVCRD